MMRKDKKKKHLGLAALEYAIIAAGVAIVIITAVNSLGDAVKTKFTAITTALTGS